MISRTWNLAVWSALALSLPALLIGANHREAPITALDHKADITDVFAFVSYSDSMTPEQPSHVTFILCVDPLLEPANGPTLFPFDPDIMYEIKVDNNHDAKEDLSFQFRFRTDYRLSEKWAASFFQQENTKSDQRFDTRVVLFRRAHDFTISIEVESDSQLDEKGFSIAVYPNDWLGGLTDPFHKKRDLDYDALRWYR